MNKKNQDSDDIERAVYDGMQDLRIPALKPPPKAAKPARKRARAARRKSRR